MSQNQLTLIEDEYIKELQEDKAQAILQIQLKDGTYVYSDDNRPGFELPFWLRLKNANLPIEKIFIKFRTERIEPFSAYEKPSGFFFIKSCIKSSSSKNANHFYNLGGVFDERIIVRTYSVPSLIFFSETYRSLEENKDFVIWNNC